MTEIRMEETQAPVGAECSGPSCPACKKAAEEAAENEEMGMAFLLAMLPVITITFFGQVGLL